MPRSAPLGLITVVVTVAVLFVESGSCVVAEVTMTVLVIVGVTSALTTMGSWTLAPLASDNGPQVMVPPAWPVQPGGIEARATLGCRKLVSAISGAVAGPLFVTVIVYVRLSPSVTLGAALIATARSALMAGLTTAVVTAAVSLARFGSVVKACTLALSVMLPT